MTRTFFIYENFEIYSVAEDYWKKDKHRHNFFELLYIEYGKGVHLLNANEYSYNAGDIYMLTLQDIHSFRTTEPTAFHCLRFLPGFFSGKQELQTIENTFVYHNQAKGSVNLEEGDQAFCELLILKIVEEATRQKKQSTTIIQHLMQALVRLIYRNVLQDMNPVASEVSGFLKVDHILNYIRLNIANPVLLRKKVMATHFNVSEHYIGEYFKKHLHLPLRAYIEQAKLCVITEKMRQSNLSFSEISQDLGFKDSSHFYKFVKRTTGKSPTEYRQSLKACEGIV